MHATSSAIEYRRLEERLLAGRAMGNLSSADEDALLDEMDIWWWRMTDEERLDADARPMSPPDAAPAVIGTDRPEGAKGWPRELVAA